MKSAPVGAPFRSLFAVLALVVATLLAGVALRADQLTSRSLWSDELFTLAIALYHPLWPEAGQALYERKQVTSIGEKDSFLTAKAAEQSPPLNDLLEKATVTWLGPTELAARLPAFASSVLLLLAVAARLWRLPSGDERTTMIWYLLLLALYPALAYYAKDGRAYGLGASLIGMALLWWWPRWQQGTAGWRPMRWAEALLWLLACWTHYNAAIVVALCLLLELHAAWRHRRIRGLTTPVAVGAGMLVWVYLNAHTILFTSKGGVAWPGLKSHDLAALAIDHMSVALHAPWLGMALVAGLIHRWSSQFNCRAQRRSRSLSAPLVLLPLGLGLYVALAAWVVVQAGMAHPRYYLFGAPLAALWMACVLARVRPWRWQLIWGVVTIALALPGTMTLRQVENENFKAMSAWAAQRTGLDTPILYPWEPNLNTYRVYMQRYLQRDPKAQMRGLSHAEHITSMCQTLAPHGSLVIIGHESGKPLMRQLADQCAQQWPVQAFEQFHNTFAFHLRKQ